MKKGAKPYSEQSRVRLLELWQGDDDYGRPMGCVATTFTFDAAFFEEQCLGRFLRIQSNANETAKAYVIEREEKLSQCFACVIVDRSHVARERSLRWNQLPVTIATGGAQHSKLSILVWERHIRVLIGSANLTEPAYRKNQEHVAVLDFSSPGIVAPALLKECVVFIEGVRRFAPGIGRMDAGPQSALEAFLQMVEQRADDLPTPARADESCSLIALIPSQLPRVPSVLRQLEARWRGPAPDRARTVSPFFNQGAEAAGVAKELAGLLTSRGSRSMEFNAPGRVLPDGTTQIDLPATLLKPSHSSLTHLFNYIDENVTVEGTSCRRPLHAKSIWLQRDERALFMIGSSNLTTAGLGLHPNHNIELNVCYLLPDVKSRFAALCAQSFPTARQIEDPTEAQFLGAPDSSEPSDLRSNLLDPAFGLALFRTEGTSAYVELEVSSMAPPVFAVSGLSGAPLLSAQEWREQGSPSRISVPWSDPRPPSSLHVTWTREDTQYESLWVVNVLDSSTLPAPAELSELTLDELIIVLTSARPLHEVVAGIRESNARAREDGQRIETDPHRRIDTSRYLLQRMRRASDAFEGMKVRLEEPVFSLDALRWRLHGPLGPITFAKKLLVSEGEAAPFMIAELASTIFHVQWRLGGSLARDVVDAEVRQVLSGLRSLTESTPPPQALSAYVKQTFAELLQ